MNYLRVKKWEEFQHYKDRLPPWIKLHAKLLTDYDFIKLADETKSHLMLLWLLASQMDGRLPDDPQFLRERIGAKRPIQLAVLIENGWLIREIAPGLGESPKEAAHADKHADPPEQVASTPLAGRKRDASTPLALARSRETEAYKATETEAEQTSAQARLVDPEHPPWLPVAAWSDWVAYRKARKGWTAKAASLCIRELGRLRAQGHDPTEVIERSIQNAWTGLFPPRERGRSKADKTAATAEAMYGDLVREIRGQQPPDDSIPGESKRVA